MKLAIFVFMLLTGGAMGQTQSIIPKGAVTYGCMTDGHGNCLDQSWRLITQTYGGRIDIRKGLTEQQCEHDKLKAMSKPADDEERAIAKRFADEDAIKNTANCHVNPNNNTISCPVTTDYIGAARVSSDIYRAICEKQQ